MKKNKEIKTTTLNAQMVISKTESGMDLVQVLPDNPRVGLVKPFSGSGHAQLKGDGSFDFVRRRRIRKKPVLKQLHSSLSYGHDGIDRYVFYLPADQRHEFWRLLEKEASVAAVFMKDLHKR
jgi:hypothetical protein